MHPTGRVSPIQEMQMTSVIDKNVFNIEINGTFDDCQYIMKSTFSDLDFKDKYNLGAINSVNWSRVLAQIVYYFYSGLKIMKNYGSSAVRFQYQQAILEIYSRDIFLQKWVYQLKNYS